MSEKHYYGDVGEVEYVRLKQPNISSETYYTKEYVDKQADRIAELEEQLKNAIVPKFEIGQEVWTEWKGDIVEREIKSLYWGINQVVEYRLKGGMYLISRWEDEVFATKEEAQAKLEELQGE